MTKASLKIVSWNINSVRLRLPNVEAFVAEQNPDIICFQEIKCQNAEFPEKAFKQMGLPHLAISGQRGGHHGVAIASREPIETLETPALCREGHARVNAIKVADIELHNIYLPAGGDVPDPDENDKFAHKLDFVKRLGRHYGKVAKDGVPRVLVGDLNIAPREDDVWSHKQLLKVVSHTPIEVDHLGDVMEAGGWADVTRADIPEGQLYSWWSYRSRDWSAADKGRRLDHIWASADIANAAHSSRILRDARGWEKPSDHAPVFATFDL